MKIFGMHWAIHLLYWAAVSGGFLLLKRDGEQQQLVAADVGNVQRMILPILENHNDRQLSAIQQAQNAINTVSNEARNRSARHLAQMIGVFSLRCTIVRDWAESQTADSTLRVLANDYVLLGDSLRLLLPADTALQRWLTNCLYEDYSLAQLTHWSIHSDSTERALLAQNLSLKANLALQAGLTYLLNRMQTFHMDFGAFLPVISYEQCPRAGQPFEADIYLSSYFPGDNLPMRVNGRSIPVEAGLGHYQATSGETFSLAIYVKNPLMGREYVYSKEFRVR